MKKAAKQELQKRSIEELMVSVEELRRGLFSARLHGVTKPLEDTSHSRIMRKNIARALTYLREKRGRAD